MGTLTKKLSSQKDSVLNWRLFFYQLTPMEKDPKQDCNIPTKHCNFCKIVDLSWPSHLKESIHQPKYETIVSLRKHGLWTEKLKCWTSAVLPDWAIYCSLGNHSKPLATMNLPKSPKFIGNFCKGVKIIHFSCEIILGNFYKHLAIFISSHWTSVKSISAILAWK